MLASENTSNNASDGSNNLLHLGDTGQLSFNSLSSVPLPELTPEDVLWALSMELTSSESQALEYFGGYVLKKMTKIHSGECEVCCNLGSKMTVATTGIEFSEIFLLLKRYDTDSATLFRPSAEMTRYVKNVLLLFNFCFAKYRTTPNILKLLETVTNQFIWPPKFCCDTVRERVCSHIVKTLLLYKVKWLNNDYLSNNKRKNKRKLKILQHN
jgi:hypothetical protein